MGFLTDWLTDWLKELLIEGIMGNLTGLFDTVNTRVGEIAVQVGTTPAAWNAGIFSLIPAAPFRFSYYTKFPRRSKAAGRIFFLWRCKICRFARHPPGKARLMQKSSCFWAQTLIIY